VNVELGISMSQISEKLLVAVPRVLLNLRKTVPSNVETPLTFNDANVPISVIASVPVTVRLPMITLLDRNVVVAWRTLMMALADNVDVFAVVIVLASSLRAVVLRIRSH